MTPLVSSSPVVAMRALPWPSTCKICIDARAVWRAAGAAHGYIYAAGGPVSLPALHRHEGHSVNPRTPARPAGQRGTASQISNLQPVARKLGLSEMDLYKLRPGSSSAASTGHTERLQHTVSTSHLSTVASGSAPVWRVAVVGRANVGKSSLYNRLVMAGGKPPRSKRVQLAIVGSEPGTTRDRKETLCSCGSMSLLVTDTAGMEAWCEEGDEGLLQQVNEQISQTLRVSDVILFVIDASEGVTPVDELFARRLMNLVEVQADKIGTQLAEKQQQERECTKGDPPSVIVVLNKAEGPGVASCMADVYDLQLGHPVLVSTKTNQGLEALYDRVQSTLRERGERLQISSVPLEQHEERVSTCGSASLLQDVPNASPVQSTATEAWLEGLARRYGRGVKPVLEHMQSTDNVLLPWSLEKAPLASATDQEAKEDGHQLGPRTTEMVHSMVEDDQLQDEGEMSVDDVDDGDKCAAKVDFDVAQDKHQPETKTKQPIRLTFIGRPNAGKSSLINSILREKRLTVSATPGTTTDSVCVEFSFKKQHMALVDTAGVSRGWRMRGDDLLQRASLQTMRNICGSDVCILCLDATQIEETGHISSHDLSLANLATEKEGRCLVACVTKWDTVGPSKQSSVRTLALERLQAGLGHLKSCPVVFTSATQAHNLDTLLNKALQMYKQWCSRVPTATLNAWLQQYTARWPPPWRLGSRCQVKYITQAQACPPTFVAWSNVYAHFPTHYKRQLINAIREEFGMKGVPVRLVLRTTAMPKPGTKLTKAEVLKWKRLGPHQHQAATKLARKYVVKT